MDNLIEAHKNARKGKGWYKEIKVIDKNPEKYLKELQQMFINHTYKTSKYFVFQKRDKTKTRTIYKLPYFPDRVAQWAILQVIEPYILKKFTSDTYSSIPKRGIHQALIKLKSNLYSDQENTKYCLKLDIKHYYQSINHLILKEKLRWYFKDQQLLNLLDNIIDSVNTAEIEDLKQIYQNEEIDYETGIPIGNYLSQYFGNIFLAQFDHWIKEQKGIKYYFRYMDDICIFHSSKEFLHKLFEEIQSYFAQIKLKIKSNYKIFPSQIRGIDFIGYRVFPDYILLRKSTKLSMKKRMLRIKKKIKNNPYMNYSEWCSINSYRGWLKFCNSSNLSYKYLYPLRNGYKKYYNDIIRGDSHENLSQCPVNSQTTTLLD